jgi:hypothetical protein
MFGLLPFALLLSPIALHAAGGGSIVRVEPARMIFEAGEQIELLVFNESSASIFVAGCGSLQPEVFIEEHYEPLPPTPCDEEGPARALPSGESRMSLAVPPDLVGKTGRVALIYGIGCIEGRSLSRGRCTDFGTVRSGSFLLKAPAR